MALLQNYRINAKARNEEKSSNTQFKHSKRSTIEVVIGRSSIIMKKDKSWTVQDLLFLPYKCILPNKYRIKSQIQMKPLIGLYPLPKTG